MQHIQLGRLAEGCAIEAYPRWRRTGVRIVNHPFDIGDHHFEWLTIVRPDGSMRIWQHFPWAKTIGLLEPERVETLTDPRRGRFSRREIRGLIHNETRRRR